MTRRRARAPVAHALVGREAGLAKQPEELVVEAVHKAVSETGAALAESHARAAMRDDLATEDMRVTNELAVFGAPLRNGLAGSPGVCATPSVAKAHLGESLHEVERRLCHLTPAAVDRERVPAVRDPGDLGD